MKRAIRKKFPLFLLAFLLPAGKSAETRPHPGTPAGVIYQLPVRTWAATGRGKEHTGRLDDLTTDRLRSLRELGVDHVWLTGVVEHATPGNTDPDVVKGDAGSYYAIHDAWDVDPVLGAVDDFKDVVGRAHSVGLKVLIDLVPNHTARIHRTNVPGRPDFGNNDDTSVFFSPANHYFYLPGQTFSPPARVGGRQDRDGVFDTDLDKPGIQPEKPARVTGNNIRSAAPSRNDWYETAKLNYGYDFSSGHGHYDPRPRTWDMMLDIARHWVGLGVDGFRIDFAHSVPLEFWRYFSAGIRQTKPDVFLLAEVYEQDTSMRVPGFSYEALLDAGIDAVYLSELYWALHAQAQGHPDASRVGPVNLPLTRSQIMSMKRPGFMTYIENHDEVRVASRHFSHTRGSGDDRANYGLGLATYAALLPTHFLVHGGQELGEDASEHGSFAGDNGKTSIFDHVHQPAVLNWLRGNADDGSNTLRSLYGRLLGLKKASPFNLAHTRDSGTLIDLSGPNGRKPEARWISSYLRHGNKPSDAWLVVVNTDPSAPHEATIHFTTRDGADTTGALAAMGVIHSPESRYLFTDQFMRPGWNPSDPAVSPGLGIPGDVLYRAGSVPSGLYLGSLEPGAALVLKVSRAR